MLGDKHYRSLLKAVTWRCLGTLDTVVISWIITGRLKFAVSIGVVELFTKMMLYYLHERAWAHVDWGMQ